jgi:hypothetical protein
MTVGGVGASTPGAPRQPGAAPGGAPETTTPTAPATDGGSSGGDVPNFSQGGTSSLIGADGQVRAGWGFVDAPEVKPTDPGKLIEMPKYGDVDVPAPKPDQEGKAPKEASLEPKPATEIQKPVEGGPTPIRKNKFSIVTGPPQGDP